MRIAKTLILSLALCTGTAAFAHGGNPCMSYFKTCKADASVTGAADKKTAMKECVTSAATADKDKGQKCLDFQAKHEKGGHSAAAPAAPAEDAGSKE